MTTRRLYCERCGRETKHRSKLSKYDELLGGKVINHHKQYWMSCSHCRSKRDLNHEVVPAGRSA